MGRLPGVFEIFVKRFSPDQLPGAFGGAVRFAQAVPVKEKERVGVKRVKGLKLPHCK